MGILIRLMKRAHEQTSRPPRPHRWVVALALVGVVVALLASSSWLAGTPLNGAATLADADSTRADVPAALAELADGLDGEPDARAHPAHATGEPAAGLLVRVGDGDSPGVHSLLLPGASGARSPPLA